MPALGSHIAIQARLVAYRRHKEVDRSVVIRRAVNQSSGNIGPSAQGGIELGDLAKAPLRIAREQLVALGILAPMRSERVVYHFCPSNHLAITDREVEFAILIEVSQH